MVLADQLREAGYRVVEASATGRYVDLASTRLRLRGQPMALPDAVQQVARAVSAGAGPRLRAEAGLTLESIS